MKTKKDNTNKIITLNRKCHIFREGYERQYIPPYGLSEFYAKIDTIKKRGKDKYYLFLYLVDQDFIYAYDNNDYVIGINPFYISPNFPERWENDVKRALNEAIYENKHFPDIYRNINELYYDIITWFIEINDWWIDKCDLSPMECRKEKEYCISLHSKYYSTKYTKNSINNLKYNNIEFLLTGYHKDMPGYPEKWKWIYLLNSREGYIDDINYIEDNIKKRIEDGSIKKINYGRLIL